MKQAMSWTRAFWGKHPAFTDYIRINADEKMFYAFVNLINSGWKKAAPRDAGRGSRCSIRFWAVPQGSSSMACGMITECRDAAGRRAPVLCAIKGSLPKSVRQGWEMLNLQCLAAWNDMADLMERGFDSISEFKESLSRISPPDFEAERLRADSGEMEAVRKGVRTRLAADSTVFARQKTLCFNAGNGIGTGRGCFLWMKAIKEAVDVMPDSVFIRDSDSRKELYLYYRPLTAADLQMNESSG